MWLKVLLNDLLILVGHGWHCREVIVLMLEIQFWLWRLRDHLIFLARKVLLWLLHLFLNHLVGVLVHRAKLVSLQTTLDLATWRFYLCHWSRLHRHRILVLVILVLAGRWGVSGRVSGRRNLSFLIFSHFRAEVVDHFLILVGETIFHKIRKLWWLPPVAAAWRIWSCPTVTLHFLEQIDAKREASFGQLSLRPKQLFDTLVYEYRIFPRVVKMLVHLLLLLIVIKIHLLSWYTGSALYLMLSLSWWTWHLVRLVVMWRGARLACLQNMLEYLPGLTCREETEGSLTTSNGTLICLSAV